MSSPVPFESLPDLEKKDMIIQFLQEQKSEYANYLEQLFFPDLPEQKELIDGFANLSTDLQTSQILQYLKEKNEFVKTIDLAKHFYGPKATRKDINSLLYKMQASKLIIKECTENGGNPRWKLV